MSDQKGPSARLWASSRCRRPVAVDLPQQLEKRPSSPTPEMYSAQPLVARIYTYTLKRVRQDRQMDLWFAQWSVVSASAVRPRYPVSGCGVLLGRAALRVPKVVWQHPTMSSAGHQCPRPSPKTGSGTLVASCSQSALAPRFGLGLQTGTVLLSPWTDRKMRIHLWVEMSSSHPRTRLEE